MIVILALAVLMAFDYVGIHMEIYLSAMFLKISNNYRSENLIKSTKRLTFEVHLHETKKRYGYEII